MKTALTLLLAAMAGLAAAAEPLKGLLPGESRTFLAKGASPDGALELVSEKLLAPVPLSRD